jgi:hypothetical protein
LPVRVLLDEQLPRHLARRLTGHFVRTATQCGWAGLRNGELLLRAEGAGFEAFVTADRGLVHRQNLAGSSLRIIVLLARTNKLEDLLPLIPDVLSALQDTRPEEIRRVGTP